MCYYKFTHEGYVMLPPTESHKGFTLKYQEIFHTLEKLHQNSFCSDKLTFLSLQIKNIPPKFLSLKFPKVSTLMTRNL